MVSFMKGNLMECIKYKFIFLYILNVFDIIFTLVLLKTGLFMEGNLFMAGIVTKPELSLLLKIGLIFILLFVVYKRMKTANLKQLVIASKIINFAVVAYICINISHIVWIVLIKLNILV